MLNRLKRIALSFQSNARHEDVVRKQTEPNFAALGIEILQRENTVRDGATVFIFLYADRLDGDFNRSVLLCPCVFYLNV